ncbi:hypothetical protein BGZ89_012175 [Linnemannia elongata]|nr:hypothetical protein BGZ89_012175 [Linnemannia elongata]
MNDSEELAEKYHKLFQDYTRIKAQHAVLKKAVLKEQTENTAMQAAMKEKEQEVRKSLQDLDLLSFHNQRLTKRIENLQNQGATKSGGSWLMGGGSVKKELEKSQTTLEAATIDLQAKIEENEKLHQQLYEINALYPRHVTELQGKIQALEKQNQELQVDVQRAGVANEDTIAMIRKEKESMEKELRMIRDALAGQLKDEQRSSQNLRDKVERLENEIERLSKIEVELEALQGEHSKLKGELETLKWISSELSQLQESFHRLEQEKVQIDKAHAQLSQQHTALKHAEESARRTLVQIQDSLRAAQDQNRKLTQDLETVRREAYDSDQNRLNHIQQLESELASVRKEQEQLKGQYEDLKVAEQAAKAGESQTKAELVKDLSNMEANLAATAAKVKDLEEVRASLEKELIETKEALKAEQEKANAVTLEAPKEDSNVDNEAKTEPEDNHVTEEEGAEKDKAPLSKKARKKKAAAAAAAAAATAAAAKEDETADEPSKELKAIKRTGDTALEAAKDEKQSLSSSLEMHVDLTLQLQQEVDEMKSSLAKKQVVNSARRSPVMKQDDDDEPLVRTRQKSGAHGNKGDHTPQRASTPVPTAALTESSKTVEAKDESTQVEKVEASDKAVQSESVERVDESTQVEVAERSVAKAESSSETDKLDKAKNSEDVAESKEASTGVSGNAVRAIDDVPTTRSMLGQEAINSTGASTSHQANREFLIKKHYEVKLQNITEQLQLSDGRYARLHKEFGMLKELLLETVREKEAMGKEYHQLQAKNELLQEELAAAKEDNRAQVETMTNFMKSLDHGR